MYVDDDVMFGRPYTFSNVPRKLDDKKGCFSFVFEMHARMSRAIGIF